VFFGAQTPFETGKIHHGFRDCFQIAVLDTSLVPEAWRSDREEGNDPRPRSTMSAGYCGCVKFPLCEAQSATRVAQMSNRFLCIATVLCLQAFGQAQERRDPFQPPASGNPSAPVAASSRQTQPTPVSPPPAQGNASPPMSLAERTATIRMARPAQQSPASPARAAAAQRHRKKRRPVSQ
jgi:hypothetical protein